MRRHFTAFFCNAAFVSAASFAQAEEVTLSHNDLTLLADFVEAEDASGPVALITHGTLAHKDMELVEALQDSLAEQGITSLAHTLSLGVSERRGMIDCAMLHAHRDEDADLEIAVWIDWLKEQGQEEIALVGHSRGGKQVARTAATRDDLAAVILMAPAIAASAERARAARSAELTDTIASLPEDATEPITLAQFVYCEDATATPEAIRSYYSDRPTGADTYTPDITAPILVIAGSNDTVVPEVPATFIPLIGDGLRFELIEDADHMFLDFYVEDAATLIAEFLTDLPHPEDGPDFDSADLAYGEYLGSECLACHKADGAEGIPPIAGHDAAHLFHSLNDYASGARDHAAMRLVAKSLDAEQRLAVAAYFASLEAD